MGAFIDGLSNRNVSRAGVILPNGLQHTREITIPVDSRMTVDQYRTFLVDAHKTMSTFGVFAPSEGVNTLELAHLVPSIPESSLAIFVGINDAICRKVLLPPGFCGTDIIRFLLLILISTVRMSLPVQLMQERF